MKPEEVDRLLALLVETIPNAELEEHNIEGYENVLAPFDYEAGQQAVMNLIHDGERFMPTAGEIASEIARISIGPDQSAVAAWLKVLSEIRDRNHELKNAEFDDPRTRKTVRSIGRTNLSRDPHEHRRVFVETWQQIDTRERREFLDDPAAYEALPRQQTREIESGEEPDLIGPTHDE